MPELPEVETIKRSLEKVIVGKTIKDIESFSIKQLSGNKEDITDKKIVSLQRKGKVLSIKTENNIYLNIHLKMSGQLIFSLDRNNAVFNTTFPRTKTNKLPTTITRIVLDFTDESALFFNDIRKFGWIKISKKIEGPKGVDVLSPEFTIDYFKSLFSSSKKPIKTFLLDQNLIAGIGNIYANDSLFEAKIHPTRKVNSLNKQEIERLYKGIKIVIEDGIKYKGSSAKDENYILPDASKGSYQHHFRVYHRTGLPCPRCGTAIESIKQGGRSSFYCPQCQKN